MTKPCVHFVGFKDTGQYWRATKIFGPPDFIHRYWDVRARFGGEFDPTQDIIVFATGQFDDPPRPFAFDDSAHFR